MGSYCLDIHDVHIKPGIDRIIVLRSCEAPPEVQYMQKWYLRPAPGEDGIFMLAKFRAQPWPSSGSESKLYPFELLLWSRIRQERVPLRLPVARTQDLAMEGVFSGVEQRPCHGPRNGLSTPCLTRGEGTVEVVDVR